MEKPTAVYRDECSHVLWSAKSPLINSSSTADENRRGRRRRWRRGRATSISTQPFHSPFPYHDSTAPGVAIKRTISVVIVIRYVSIPSRRRTQPKRRNPAEDVAQLAGPKQPEEDDSRCDRDCGSPVRPLTQVCVPHVFGVDAEDACH